MSDFFSAGWSVFIAAATILGLLGCLVLLVIASRTKAASKDGSTGHVWDVDLKEMNNPLPLWWMGLFVITIVFGGLYLALYPGLGSAAGTLKWSSDDEYRAEQGEATRQMIAVYAKFAAMPANALAKEPQAMAIGERLFINNCAACHGSDARGSKGFPNLTDTDWLYGGSPEAIVETITHGRQGTMPPMAAAVGTASDVSNVANYVLSLSGSPHNSIAAAAGRSKFAACAACHGPDGKGNQALGAPNLTDKVWLHGWGHDAIVAMINNGKTNVMPAQEKRLTPEQIHVLAAYVWSLSNSSALDATTAAAAK
ncbi:MAG TPA: cytochrome-c oxidase, cbb3-type subunit III [Burkholderiaceae bacterium]|nr:cytochrome-c oxidase, cbb3-type subunit III [Burkholderiaceae bacterium]